MNRRAARVLMLSAAALAASATLADESHARPGSGETFSPAAPTQSASDRDERDDSDHNARTDLGELAELIGFVVRLTARHPWVGGPVLLTTGLFALWLHRRGALTKLWAFRAGAPDATDEELPERTPAVDLSLVRARDPDFSRVLFEDFAFRLYAQLYRARHDERLLGALAPYLDEPQRAAWAAEGKDAPVVAGVVVGGLVIERCTLEGPYIWLLLGFVANVAFESAGAGTDGGARAPEGGTLFLHERWHLRRATTATTPAHALRESLGCPACGAPYTSSDAGRCAHCDQRVTDGRFGWQLVRRTLIESGPRPSSTDDGAADERAALLPTVAEPRCAESWRELLASDASLTEAGLDARLGRVFGELNAAWTARDLEGLRPLVSDCLFDYLRYGLARDRAQQRRNVLERAELVKTERVKVIRDRHFDAVTLRLWARGLEYTLREPTGEVIAGSRTTPRSYSEYWTLIRSSKAPRASGAGAQVGQEACPSCGGPVRVSMAGRCEHCGTHVTSGEFDWVLSKIEQARGYRG